MDAHYSGKNHRKRQFQESKREQQEGKGVYINQLGDLKLSSTQAYFSQFGTITNIFIGWDKAKQDKMYSLIIEYEEEASVQKILSRDLRNKHWVPVVPGERSLHRVRVSERKVSNARPRSPSPPPPPQISFGEIQVCLSVLTDMDEQIEEIMHLTELCEEDIQERNAICKNISKTFAMNGYPNCIVSPFGSTVNGLGFRGCDVDIYLDLGEIPVNRSLSDSVDFTSDANPLMSADESCDDSLNQEQPNDQSNSSKQSKSSSKESQIKKVRLASQLLRHIPHCCRIHPITGARVPIVKFIHRRTGINCDMSFKNRASVLNSEYIRFCTEMDHRLRPLMMAIRLVFKRYDMAGGGGGAKISNYALTMMIIVYLQQLEKPLLHPLHVLQQFIEGEPELVDGWNFSFCADISKLPPLPVNKQGLFELFLGFFKFYSEVDLKSKFLSPFLGKIIDRSILKDSLPAEYSGRPEFLGPEGLLLDKLICLQDPFELTFNMCRNLPERGYRTLVSLFNQMFKACSQIKESSCPGGFNKLLNLEIVPDENIELPDPMQVFNGTNVYMAFLLPDISEQTLQKHLDKITTDIQDKAALTDTSKIDTISKDTTENEDNTLQEDSQDKELVTDGAKEQKMKKMELMISVIFSKCLQFMTAKEYEEKKASSKSQDGSQRSNEDESCQPDEKRTKLDFCPENSKGATSTLDPQNNEWVVFHQVWSGRKRFHAEVYAMKEDLSVLEKEIKITEEQRSKYTIMVDIPPDIIFKHHVKMYQNHICLGLEMVQSRKKLYENLFAWLRSYLPELLKSV